MKQIGLLSPSPSRYLAGENSCLPNTDTKLTCRIQVKLHFFYPYDGLSVFFFPTAAKGTLPVSSERSL